MKSKRRTKEIKVVSFLRKIKGRIQKHIRNSQRKILNGWRQWLAAAGVFEMAKSSYKMTWSSYKIRDPPQRFLINGSDDSNSGRR